MRTFTKGFVKDIPGDVLYIVAGVAVAFLVKLFF